MGGHGSSVSLSSCFSEDDKGSGWNQHVPDPGFSCSWAGLSSVGLEDCEWALCLRHILSLAPQREASM